LLAILREGDAEDDAFGRRVEVRLLEEGRLRGMGRSGGSEEASGQRRQPGQGPALASRERQRPERQAVVRAYHRFFPSAKMTKSEREEPSSTTRREACAMQIIVPLVGRAASREASAPPTSDNRDRLLAELRWLV